MPSTQNNEYNLCDCNITTTTTCFPVSERPCVTLCDDLYNHSCIIYDGEDLDCYGIKNGDNLKDILDKIIIEIQGGEQCACDLGTLIGYIVTTTTDAPPIPQSLCINIHNEQLSQCSTENVFINSTSFENGKVVYSFNYESASYTIKWSITNNRWELLTSTTPIAYLESTEDNPIGPLISNDILNPSLSWFSLDVLGTSVVTRTACPDPICLEFETQSGISKQDFISFYDQIGNAIPGLTVFKNVYKSCSSDYVVKFNPFTQQYELYISLNKVAYINLQDLYTLNYVNWTVTPAYLASFISIKSKGGSCIDTSTTTTTLSTTTSTSTSTSTSTTSTTTIIPCSQPVCGQTYEGYGYLYNWRAIFGAGAQTNGGRNVGGIVNTSQPYGDERNEWRVPSEEDWNTLIGFIDPSYDPAIIDLDIPQSTIAGGKLKSICTFPFTTSNGLWATPNTGATNEYNWNGIPGGRVDDCDWISGLNGLGWWWSSGQFVPGAPFYRLLRSNNGGVIRYYRTGLNDGMSIRLVRPATTSELSLSDGITSNQNASLPHYIGNSRSYITVKIGNQVWTAQNLIDEVYNNGTPIIQDLTPFGWCSATTGLRAAYDGGVITPDQGQIELCGLSSTTTTSTTSTSTTTTSTSTTTSTTTVAPIVIQVLFEVDTDDFITFTASTLASLTENIQFRFTDSTPENARWYTSFASCNPLNQIPLNTVNACFANFTTVELTSLISIDSQSTSCINNGPVLNTLALRYELIQFAIIWSDTSTTQVTTAGQIVTSPVTGLQYQINGIGCFPIA